MIRKLINDIWDTVDDALIDRDYRNEYAAYDRETASDLAVANGMNPARQAEIDAYAAVIAERLARLDHPLVTVRFRHVLAVGFAAGVVLAAVL